MLEATDLPSDAPTQTGYVKTAALRRALDRGLAAWRAAPAQSPRYLSLHTLYAALRYLEAGYRLGPAHLELILRSALALRVGLSTALRFQRGAHLVADAVTDALLDPGAPLPLEDLWRLQRSEHGDIVWQRLAVERLRLRLTSVPALRRAHVQAAIYQLETGLPLLEGVDESGLRGDTQGARFTPGMWWGVGLVAAVVIVLAVLWGQGAFRSRSGGWVDTYVMIAGPRAASDPGGARPEFAMMRYEVTNQQYRACVASGACEWPVAVDSATRIQYFLQPEFDTYPVVNVTQNQAAIYCAWRDGRLPTEEEWQLAASYSSLTDRWFIFPWGDQFDGLRANGRSRGIGDTYAVGTDHPQGSSPAGIADLAGNVAEWTATIAPEGATGVIVKGGSYLDGAGALRVDAAEVLPRDFARAWIGFRCVR